jgi:hypothetical protein
MAKEITTTGSKKVGTLMKEFNKNYPFLRLKICDFSQKAKVDKGETITGVDIDKTLSEVRTKKGVGQITLTGNKFVGTIEKEFESIFGLYVQICYTNKDNTRIYTTGNEDKKSLSTLNKEKETLGCKKDEWK